MNKFHWLVLIDWADRIVLYFLQLIFGQIKIKFHAPSRISYRNLHMFVSQMNVPDGRKRVINILVADNKK